MRVAELRTVSRLLGLDSDGVDKACLAYNLVVTLHGESGMQQLPLRVLAAHKQRCRAAPTGWPTKRRAPLAEKAGGSVGRAPDKGMTSSLAAYRASERARRCKDGSMCKIHLEQLAKAREVDRLLKLDSAEEAEAALLAESFSAVGVEEGGGPG
eukprot:7380028-Prymnesium_polylepis.2